MFSIHPHCRPGYEAAFKRFDRDGNGFLSREEVHKALREANSPMKDSEIDEGIQKLDCNRDGKISLQEFLKLI